MTLPVLQVEQLSKRYRLGATVSGERSFREMLSAGAGRLLRPWKVGPRNAAGDPSAPDADQDFWALRQVSFTVPAGEVLGIIGRNGAGKSTLLKLLSGITEPTSGRALIRGRVSSLLEVGTGFHPELTGRENIYLNGAILGLRQAEIRRKFDSIVDFAEIERFLDTPVKRYSSGMYMRLAFAVAAHLEPDILIVDEVLAVGDAAFQKKCLGKMQDVAGAGRTVLFVSHNLNAVSRLCRQCLWLERGQLKLQGPARAVVERYLTAGVTAAEACFELRPDTPVQFRRLRITDASGQVRGELPDDQPWAIEAELEVTVARSPEVYIGLGLRNAQGTDVLLADSRDVGPTFPRRLERGRHAFRVTLPPVLAPGKYYLAAGVGTPSLTFFDYHDPACALNLVDVASSRLHQRQAVLNLRLPFEPLREAA